jgi:succinate dehydrogenase / fumarate reductase cytochrome b subunit
MLQIREAFKSTLGQKYLTSITGAGLVIFIIFHLISNLALLAPNSNIYNSLSNSLVALGGWLELAEVLLLGVVAIHILVALYLKFLSMRARPNSYASKKTKHGPSKLGFSSTGLLLSGTVIFVFLIIHVAQFKFGANISEGYSVSIQGKLVRDLHRLVVETFRNNYWAAFYVGCMVFLGFHLRHGMWSLFQSLGVTNRRTTGPLYTFGSAFAVIIAVGFALIPLFITLGGGGLSR